jgi:hypothetical protein
MLDSGSTASTKEIESDNKQNFNHIDVILT